jgi:putative nucleotidyltransferase with HDIG domain
MTGGARPVEAPEQAPEPAPELLDELERLPANPTAAMRVLWIADDPVVSSDELAAVVSSDPALTARVMRMANSAYFGLAGRVASARFAVTLLGFSTVRSLAAAAAAGLLDDDGAAVPPGFWSHAAATAAGAALVAPRVGARRPDAFSAGLLHDLGQALLYRSDPERFLDMVHRVETEGIPLAAAERATFGLTHEQATARVLAAWRFPTDFVAAIAHHHDDPTSVRSRLGRALMAGEALAARLGNAPRHEGGGSRPEALRLASVDEGAAARLVDQVRREALEVETSLGFR